MSTLRGFFTFAFQFSDFTVETLDVQLVLSQKARFQASTIYRIHN